MLNPMPAYYVFIYDEYLVCGTEAILTMKINNTT